MKKQKLIFIAFILIHNLLVNVCEAQNIDSLTKKAKNEKIEIAKFGYWIDLALIYEKKEIKGS